MPVRVLLIVLERRHSYTESETHFESAEKYTSITVRSSTFGIVTVVDVVIDER